MRPYFAASDVVERIERAECELLRAGAEAARRRDPGAGVLTVPLAGGFATWGGSNSPLNKVAGLGFAGAPRAEELAALEFAFAQRATPVRVELASLADPAVSGFLAGRGYRFVGFENVLGLPLDGYAPDAAAPEIDVRPSDEPEFQAWLDAVVTGFAQPDDQGVPTDEEFPRAVLEQVIGDLANGEGFSRYMARRGGEIAGGASLRMGDGVAQLCGAATLPAHRRRGVQTALLRKRLELARDAGCDIAVVTTQPGSKSQQNVQREGFHLLYGRAVLIRQ
jgi:GNAT superfamily N-acetyltransferase